MTGLSAQLKSKIAGKGIVIAVDGPSGSGKSSVTKTAALALGLQQLDTGATYRAFTAHLLRQGILSPDTPVDEHAIHAAAQNFRIQIDTDPHGNRVYLGNDDVTALIRTPEITSQVSRVASIPPVRALLIAQQRHVVNQAQTSGQGIILEGRDATTVIVPDAPVRVLLTASEEARAARRDAQEGAGTGRKLAHRDAQDRKVNNFETPAPGVVLLDSSLLTFDETLEAFYEIALRALAPETTTP